MTNESKIYWSVGIVSVLFIIGSLLVPGDPKRSDDLPWHIEHPTSDTVRVFGLTLGESVAKEAQERFKEEATPSLFKSPDGKLAAELFFDHVKLGGLPSTVILTINVPKTELEGMYERGLRMAATESGKKITLTPEDVRKLDTWPISSLTYLPGLHVEEAIFLKRFGQPAQRIQEKKSGLVHWLYPHNGLDIILGSGEKPVLQYVSPRDFDKLVKPLMANGGVLK
jgi:hypothetical protein